MRFSPAGFPLAVPVRAAALTLTLFAALALPGGPLAAQQTPPARPGGPPQPPQPGIGEIRGSVVDAEGNTPVGSATVAVYSRADSALVAGAVARPDGSFHIQGLRRGRYYLRVTMVGYAPNTSTELVIGPPSPLTEVGAVRLTRRAVALEGIEATGERGAVAIAPDRNAYRVRDVAPAATTASEVLEAVPSVEVDGEGRVSLRGNESVVVQINGRPTPIRGAQLAGYLKQLPANTVERVEVVPNPSARYDPEGMAGIINIVLRQNVELGVSGGVNLTASTAGRYAGAGNLGYQRGPATWFFTYGYTSDDRELRGETRRTRLDALRAPLAFTRQDVLGSAGSAGHNLTATLDYKLNPRDLLSAAILANVRESTDGTLSEYTERDGGQVLLDRYERVRDIESENRMFDATLAWKRTLQPQRHEISAEVRYNDLDDRDRTDLLRRALGGAGGFLDGEIDDLDAGTRQLTAQLDYTRALSARTRLETGYRGNVRWLDRDYQVRVDPLGSGDFAESGLSNALELDEQVNAGYAVVSHGTGPWELQAGLRAEYASRDFTLASEDRSFPDSYASLFPSALAAYKLGERSQLKASYSRRIRRPGAQELNPFPVFFDIQNVFVGNPELDPEYTDAVELGYQYSAQAGSLQVSPFYRRTTDIIRAIINAADSVAGREVTSVSYANLNTGTSWGTDVNGSLRLGKRFSGLAGFNVYKLVTEGASGESGLRSDAVTWSARFNGTFNLTERTALQALAAYRAPMNIERGRFSSSFVSGVALRQKVYGEQAVVTLRVSDVFNTSRFRLETGDDNLLQLTERKFNTRALHVGFQYNFGRPPRLRQRPQEQQEQEPQPGFPG